MSDAACGETMSFTERGAHRTFGCDVWKCPCGGQRRVVALVTNRRTAEEMLRNMGMLDVAPPLPQAPGPQQLQLVQ